MTTVTICSDFGAKKTLKGRQVSWVQSWSKRHAVETGFKSGSCIPQPMLLREAGLQALLACSKARGMETTGNLHYWKWAGGEQAKRRPEWHREPTDLTERRAYPQRQQNTTSSTAMGHSPGQTRGCLSEPSSVSIKGSKVYEAYLPGAMNEVRNQ